MKSLKSNYKKILVVLLAVAILGGGSVYAGISLINGEAIGTAQSEINKKYENNDEIIAKVNDHEISKKEFEIYKSNMSHVGDYSDSELLDKLVEKKIMYDKAVALGYTTTNDEIEAAIAEAKGLLSQKENLEQYNFLKQYIDGLEITEEQYWAEIVVPIYKETFTINKLIESLKSNYTKENGTINMETQDDGFSDYMAKYKKSLISEADIQILESVS